MRLILATHNQHKLREFSRLLAGVELIPLPDGVQLAPEDGDTFAANALPKARVAAQALGLPAIGDDSGIESEALGGRPGVRSARYAGPAASDRQNLALLLSEAPAGSRLAYVCALAYARPPSASDRGCERVFEARCEGRLAAAPAGSGGFGYDPAFLPDDDGSGRTMAQLSDAEKDAISHRGRAARMLLAWLRG